MFVRLKQISRSGGYPAKNSRIRGRASTTVERGTNRCGSNRPLGRQNPSTSARAHRMTDPVRSENRIEETRNVVPVDRF